MDTESTKILPHQVGKIRIRIGTNIQVFSETEKLTEKSVLLHFETCLTTVGSEKAAKRKNPQPNKNLRISYVFGGILIQSPGTSTFPPLTRNDFTMKQLVIYVFDEKDKSLCFKALEAWRHPAKKGQ